VEEVGYNAREEVPPNIIFRKLIREGVGEGESWFFEGILRMDVNNQGKGRGCQADMTFSL